MLRCFNKGVPGELTDIHLYDLFEKRGVWNRVITDFENSNQEYINYIYNYVRKEIIKNLNNGYKNCRFNVDHSMLFYIKALDNYNKIDIVYRPKDNIQPDDTHMSTVSHNKKEITIYIYIKIFHKDFKTIFFHEMHHVCQKCELNSKKTGSIFLYDFLFNFDILFGPKNKHLLSTLDKIVYNHNPMEINAHKEKFYKDAYLYVIENPSIDKDILKIELEEFFYNEYCNTAPFISHLHIADSVVMKYIWCLIFTTYNYIEDKPDISYYSLFNKSIYKNSIVKELIDDLLYKRRFNVPHDFYNELANEFPNFYKDKEFKKQVLDTFKRGISKQESLLKTKILQSISIAVDDAIGNNKEEFVYDYVNIIYEKNMEAEIICKDLITKKEIIYTYRLFFIEDLFKKKAILDLYLDQTKFNTEFGFDFLNNMYKEWIYKNPQYLEKNNEIKKPNITSLKDIEHLLDYICKHF